MFAVDISYLYPESCAPCDLYKKTVQGEFVFFAQKNTPIIDRVKETLDETLTRTLYIQKDDVDHYFDYVNNELKQLVTNPAVQPEKKAEAVYSSCKTILSKVFEDPRATFINQACETITPTVDLIISNRQATKHLVALTAHDHSTYVHSTNVGIFSIALARIFFGDSAGHDMQKLGMGFFLHDLGKCRIPLAILNKPGPLTPEERQVINQHPEAGYQLLHESGRATEEAQIIALQHHERDDGKGYPFGLHGNDIHPYARICRLADVYEALTCNRPYHKQRTTFEALKIIQENMSDLDRELLRCFVQLFN